MKLTFANSLAYANALWFFKPSGQASKKAAHRGPAQNTPAASVGGMEQPTPSRRRIAKEAAIDKLKRLRLRLEKLKAQLAAASPAQARALIGEIRAIARELRAVGNALQENGKAPKFSGFATAADDGNTPAAAQDLRSEIPAAATAPAAGTQQAQTAGEAADRGESRQSEAKLNLALQEALQHAKTTLNAVRALLKKKTGDSGTDAPQANAARNSPERPDSATSAALYGPQASLAAPRARAASDFSGSGDRRVDTMA